MIKNGIKNYFSSLKYAFTLIGIFALGVVLGLSVLIPGIISALSELVDNIKTVVQSIEFDFDAVVAYLTDAALAIDYSSARTVANTVLSADWIREVLLSCIDALVGGSAAIEGEIAAALDACITSIITDLVACLLIMIAGLLIGYYFTRWLVRRSIAKRSLWKFLLATLADSIFSVGLIVFMAWLATLWWVSVFISVIVGIVLVGLVSLFEAYMVHGKGRVGLREVVNIKNILLLLLTNVIVLLISVAISALVIYINLIVGIFIALSFVLIAIMVAGLNAEAYVKSLSDKRANEEKTV